jgi:transcription-repair coupling factor (superfamily II helicase)
MSRKWAGIENADDRKEWLAELRDRFGPPPPAVASLAAAADLRIAAKTKGITSISEENGKFIFRRFDNVAVVLAPPLATPAKRLRLLATEVTRLKAPPT